nr:hypothetical protein L203_02525 [Cryptococcus depauperatus CBS 7841]
MAGKIMLGETLVQFMKLPICKLDISIDGVYR